ncbi:HSPB1-associated protein 1 homolog [Dermatophagoides farinae]|uniref:HSPB1-associated protein 1 homolog n=1 Tax=Dermatophagoides farinae TaxID=6954 RepID=UPI003F61D703
MTLTTAIFFFFSIVTIRCKQHSNSNKQQQQTRFESVERPFIIRGLLNDKWPCIQWTLNEWADNCHHETKFKFRVHRKQSSKKYDDNNKIIKIDDEIFSHQRSLLESSTTFDDDNDDDDDNNGYWENEAIDTITATMGEFIDFIKMKTKNEKNYHSTMNPFEKYSSINEYCFYSSYNHIDEMMDQKSHQSLSNVIQWNNLGLFESNGPMMNQKFSTTIWIGTTKSCTPCHQDTYGYNFVGQLYGRKQWILFPPTDAAVLYPTRIPYEESSIFSQINFKHIDLNKFPLFKQCRPYIIELKPGDLLHVPHHWWHYVENLDQCNNNEDNDQVSISVNVWIDPTSLKPTTTVDDDDDNMVATINRRDHIQECITQLLFDSLHRSIGFSNEKWLNSLNVHPIPANELLQTLNHLIGQHHADDCHHKYRKPVELQVEYLNETNVKHLSSRKISLKTLIN